jgi:membrane protease YdiL (CAAX protease family)
MFARVIPLLATVLVAVAQGLAMRASAAPLSAWAYVGAAYVALLVVALAWLRAEGALADLLRYEGGDATRGLLAAGAGIILVYGASAAALALLPTVAVRDLETLVRTAIALPQKWHRALAIVGFAAAEEIVWRGAVLRALEPRLGTVRASWAAGALYVLSAVPTLKAPLIGLAIVLAVAMTVLVRRSGRITPAILGHAMFTWLALEWILPTLWNGVG